ncbi:hypothetical protein QBC44DRAFT_383951 [Cladorrhinum sp. PSN332]|nr:hypothetical protein QBC44DRAFT_383951 [Cladorrhinum sp. PSN332]
MTDRAILGHWCDATVWNMGAMQIYLPVTAVPNHRALAAVLSLALSHVPGNQSLVTVTTTPVSQADSSDAIPEHSEACCCHGEPANETYARLQGLDGNNTLLWNITAPIWVEEPKMRGTTSILWGCIVTLVACVYTALHLNIPGRTKTEFRKFVGKLKWLGICMIAPEVVLYLALDQFLKARDISHMLRKCVPRQASGAGLTDPDYSPFDTTYGFFVCMGGLEIVKPDGARSVLSIQGVEILARKNVQVLRVPKEHYRGWKQGRYGGKGFGVDLGALVFDSMHGAGNLRSPTLPFGTAYNDSLRVRHPNLGTNTPEASDIPKSSTTPCSTTSTRTSPDSGSRGSSPAGSTSWPTYLSAKALPSFAPVAYGGVHLGAWNWPFPTYVEQMA